MSRFCRESKVTASGFVMVGGGAEIEGTGAAGIAESCRFRNQRAGGSDGHQRPMGGRTPSRRQQTRALAGPQRRRVHHQHPTY